MSQAPWNQAFELNHEVVSGHAVGICAGGLAGDLIWPSTIIPMNSILVTSSAHARVDMASAKDPFTGYPIIVSLP